MVQCKRCEICGKEKPIDDFSKSYKNRCKECVASMARMRRDSFSEKKDEEYRKIMETTDHISDDLLIDWEQRRYELAKANMQGILSNMEFFGQYFESFKEIIKSSIENADEMIKQLKYKRHDEQEIQDP